MDFPEQILAIRTAQRALEVAALRYHDLAALGGPPVTAAMLAPLERDLLSAAAKFGIAIDHYRIAKGGGSAEGSTVSAWALMRGDV